MKKKKILIVSVILALALAVSLGQLPPQAHAEELISSGFCNNRIKYTLSIDGVLTISGEGLMPTYEFFKSIPWYTNADKIVTVVISEGVSSICDTAFALCSNLVSVTIPDSVSSIGEFAFFGCPRLKTVSYNQSQESWDSISIAEGNSYLKKAFLQTNQSDFVAVPTGSCGDHLTYALADDGTLTISGVGNMDMYDFENMNIPPWITQAEQIKSVIISDGVSSIGSDAFYGCFNLTSVTVADSVSTIGDMAFFDCSSLTSITLPGSVASIGNGAFGFCSNLTSVTLPDSITSIGEEAFAECPSLTSITIPASVTSIGEGVFDRLFHDPNLTVVVSQGSYGEQYCKENDLRYQYAELHELLSSQTENLIASGFCGNNLIYVLSADGVLTISGQGKMINSANAQAYPWNAYAQKIVSVEISDGVTSIGNWAFAYSSRLTTFIIPDSVTSIGDFAFGEWVIENDSSILTIVVQPGSYGEQYCMESGRKYRYAESPEQLPPQAQADEIVASGSYGDNLNYTLSTDGILTINGEGKMESFYTPWIRPWNDHAESIVSVVISDSVTSIGKGAFFGFHSLESVTISDSVTSIGNTAFDCCYSLTSITLPESITSIDNETFLGCSSLVSITIPNSVISIGKKSFNYCTSLTELTIPDSVTYIGDEAFSHCSSLTTVIIPDSVTSIGKWAFVSCPNLTLTVQKGSYAEQYCKDNALNYRYAD